MTTELNNQLAPRWGNAEKIAFRFCTLFFLLFILPFPITYIPYLDFWNRPVSRGFGQFWHTLVPWVGEHILHLSKRITTFGNGSGDTTYNYVQLFTAFMLSMLGTVLWSILDRRRADYNNAHFWLRLLVRFFLAYILLSYGFSKLFYAQMPPPTLYELIQPFGDKSPMGLAWSYVGYSHAFSVITGLAEIIGGLLLLFRRTVVLGSLLNVFVMGNVVIMNFCFDVPVKIYSSTLFLLSLFLLVPDMKRLSDMLIRNKPVPATDIRYPLSKKWVKYGTVLKFLFFAWVLWTFTNNNLKKQEIVGPNRPKPPLHGLYEVKEFIRGKDTLPLLVTDSSVWRNFVIEFRRNAVIKFMNDSMQRYITNVDTIAHTIQMYPFYPVNDTTDKSLLHYELSAAGLTFEGSWSGDSVKIRMDRKDASQYRLVSRGFHWINESPYHY